MNQRNETVWMIGASAGIGRAVAEKLATQGKRLAVSARSADKLSALKNALPGAGHIAVACDVTDQASVDQAYEQVKAEFGVPDMVIYCAGVYTPMRAGSYDAKVAIQTIDINFNGALRVLSKLLPDFRSRKSGQLALTASVAGYFGMPNSFGYGASKAALIHLAQSLKTELEDDNIKVQVINPGFVKTRLTDQNDFDMPFIISAEKAADRIVNGLKSSRFEIHFPKRFSWMLKTIRLLPDRLFFMIMRQL